MQTYILDHYYAIDHKKYCRVIKSNRPIEEIKEIITTILFYYEENIDKSGNPTLDSVIDILCKNYGFIKEDKEKYKEDIECIIEQAEEDGFPSDYEYAVPIDINTRYIYLELYEIRDSLCGEGQPNKLYSKWLTKEKEYNIKILLIAEE